MGLAFAFAWIMQELSGVAHRVSIFLLAIAELIGAAWLLSRTGLSFSPWPAVVAVAVATILGIVSYARLDRCGSVGSHSKSLAVASRNRVMIA